MRTSPPRAKHGESGPPLGPDSPSFPPTRAATRAPSAHLTASGRAPRPCPCGTPSPAPAPARPRAAPAPTRTCARTRRPADSTIRACSAGLRCCSDANPLPPPCAASGIRSLIAVDSSTVITAVPIEAPPWRMMFIAVLTRGIASRGTACIAAVIVGIIASPIPSPRTTLKADRSTYEVVAVDERERHQPDHQQRDPGRRQVLRPVAVGQPAGDRHRDHRADPLRDEQQTGAAAPRRRGPTGSRAGSAATPRRTRSRTAGTRSPTRPPASA